MSIHNNETHDEQYVGCVVATYERNYYDDSDFYAVVWDEAEQDFNPVLYASTRGYCTTWAEEDASEELMMAYKLWCDHAERITKVTAAWEKRTKLIELRKACGLTTYHPLKELEDAYRGDDRYLACVRLLKTKKFRSQFRKDMNDQLRIWLATPANERRYFLPFSQKQMYYI